MYTPSMAAGGSSHPTTFRRWRSLWTPCSGLGPVHVDRLIHLLLVSKHVNGRERPRASSNAAPHTLGRSGSWTRLQQERYQIYLSDFVHFVQDYRERDCNLFGGLGPTDNSERTTLAGERFPEAFTHAAIVGRCRTTWQSSGAIKRASSSRSETLLPWVWCLMDRKPLWCLSEMSIRPCQ